jgi:16S rRNA (guanine(1405)-N(7))-methyltransferase
VSDGAPEAEARLVEELRGSRKYRHVCGATLARVARWALRRAGTPRGAAEIARRKLHQVYGAYFRPGEHRAVEKALASLADAPGPQEVHAACRRVLGMHASTRERLPILDRCFADVFAATGPPRSLVDAACGLGAFALPWMGLPPGAPYIPLDIDTRLAELSNRLLVLLGREPSARCLDLLGDEAPPEADVTLLLKTVPCLDRQDTGASAAVLARLRSRAVVVSFPLQSLGGRERGMRESYGRRIRELLGGGALRELAYPGEVFYVWNRG